ncbi:MAG: hypothetical protein WCG78_08555, partial [Candidatus Omnitrophota bacterium]
HVLCGRTWEFSTLTPAETPRLTDHCMAAVRQIPEPMVAHITAELTALSNQEGLLAEAIIPSVVGADGVPHPVSGAIDWANERLVIHVATPLRNGRGNMLNLQGGINQRRGWLRDRLLEAVPAQYRDRVDIQLIRTIRPNDRVRVIENWEVDQTGVTAAGEFVNAAGVPAARPLTTSTLIEIEGERFTVANATESGSGENRTITYELTDGSSVTIGRMEAYQLETDMTLGVITTADAHSPLAANDRVRFSGGATTPYLDLQDGQRLTCTSYNARTRTGTLLDGTRFTVGPVPGAAFTVASADRHSPLAFSEQVRFENTVGSGFTTVPVTWVPFGSMGAGHITVPSPVGPPIMNLVRGDGQRLACASYDPATLRGTLADGSHFSLDPSFSTEKEMIPIAGAVVTGTSYHSPLEQVRARNPALGVIIDSGRYVAHVDPYQAYLTDADALTGNATPTEWISTHTELPTSPDDLMGRPAPVTTVMPGLHGEPTVIPIHDMATTPTTGLAGASVSYVNDLRGELSSLQRLTDADLQVWLDQKNQYNRERAAGMGLDVEFLERANIYHDLTLESFRALAISDDVAQRGTVPLLNNEATVREQFGMAYNNFLQRFHAANDAERVRMMNMINNFYRVMRESRDGALAPDAADRYILTNVREELDAAYARGEISNEEIGQMFTEANEGGVNV